MHPNCVIVCVELEGFISPPTDIIRGNVHPKHRIFVFRSMFEDGEGLLSSDSWTHDPDSDL